MSSSGQRRTPPQDGLAASRCSVLPSSTASLCLKRQGLGRAAAEPFSGGRINAYGARLASDRTIRVMSGEVPFANECGGMDPETRSYLLEILGLVLRWERSVSQWDAIERALGEMTIALAADDIKSLTEVAMDVERYGPLRLRTRIGDKPQVRARRKSGSAPTGLYMTSIRRVLRRAVSPPIPVRTPPIMSRPMLTEQALVVHLFVSAAGPRRNTDYDQLVSIWNCCARDFGMTDPVRGLDLPTDLPPGLPRSPGTAVLGARQAAGDGVFQVIVRSHHDVLCVSVALGRDRWPTPAGSSLTAAGLRRRAQPLTGLWANRASTWPTAAMLPGVPISGPRSAVPSCHGGRRSLRAQPGNSGRSPDRLGNGRQPGRPLPAADRRRGSLQAMGSRRRMGMVSW